MKILSVVVIVLVGVLAASCSSIQAAIDRPHVVQTVDAQVTANAAMLARLQSTTVAALTEQAPKQTPTAESPQPPLALLAGTPPAPQQPVAQSQAPAPPPGTTKWEYKLDVVPYDAQCEQSAMEPHKGFDAVKSNVDAQGYSRYGFAAFWQSVNCLGGGAALPKGMADTILQDYTSCGQQVFDAYAGKMGDQAWEMVSYRRLQYTSPALSQSCAGVIVDYGYEVMWKRPKSG
jgi:hypothetical protein